MFYGEAPSITGMSVQPNTDADEEIGIGFGEYKKRFTDFPGDMVTKGVRDAWLERNAPRMSTEQKCILRGELPSKLQAETEEFDISLLPPLGDMATSAKDVLQRDMRSASWTLPLRSARGVMNARSVLVF